MIHMFMQELVPVANKQGVLRQFTKLVNSTCAGDRKLVMWNHVDRFMDYFKTACETLPSLIIC